MKSLLASAAVLCAALALSGSPARGADQAGDKKDEKKAAAAAAAPINQVCPVEGGKVDPEVTLVHEGKTVGFCCAGCDAEFKKEPAKFMAIVAKETAAADKEKGAKDAKDGAKKDGKDKAKPKEPKLNAQCPVTGDAIDKTLTHEHKGRTVAFCCEGCVDDFKKDPNKFMAKLEQAEKDAAKKDKGKQKDEKKGA